MKKGLAHKTNTFRVQSQTGKMKRFLQEILRGDLFIQVCKQVKEQARKEGSKAKTQSWGKNHWAAHDGTEAVSYFLPAQKLQGSPAKE